MVQGLNKRFVFAISPSLNKFGPNATKKRRHKVAVSGPPAECVPQQMKLLINSLLLIGVLVLFLVDIASCDTTKKKHHYEVNEDIDFWVNNVGPHANPTETYEYYSLPYCEPTQRDEKGKMIKKKQRMGQVIQGDRAVLSDYKLPFRSMYFMRTSSYC